MLQPSAGRYMVDYGSWAVLYRDGDFFGGRSGRRLDTLDPWHAFHQDEALWLLRLLRGTTKARVEGHETLTKGNVVRETHGPRRHGTSFGATRRWTSCTGVRANAREAPYSLLRETPWCSASSVLESYLYQSSKPLTYPIVMGGLAAHLFQPRATRDGGPSHP